jgi:hypothetical protein
MQHWQFTTASLFVGAQPSSLMAERIPCNPSARK